MHSKRVTLTVEIDLDAVIGPMSTPTSAKHIVETVLSQRLTAYNPSVEFPSEPQMDLTTDVGRRHEALKLAMERHPEADMFDTRRHARDIERFLTTGR